MNHAQIVPEAVEVEGEAVDSRCVHDSVEDGAETAVVTIRVDGAREEGPRILARS